ncbi:ABC transporter ATP-binding protein [Oryzibacter oryziterrae]|uniref:ABC transporter ATP-binding protein n=1 Tax=Oryzibacter oryziterrae TaxID=2766474 RepID=UPI001F2F87E4|nr:ABC transporter ATP-binding protein [Oryzibacter oryziterrae]
MLLGVDTLSVSIGGAMPLEGIRFDIRKGEIVGIVGESGSGKSLTALAITGLLPLIGGRVSAGSISFEGTDLTKLSPRERRAYNGRRIGFITQNPMTALDPLQRIGEQVDVVSRLHLGLPPHAARARTVELFRQMRIAAPEAIAEAYPHQLSGGMKQRVVIAMALAGEPDLIVADEPTTALDVTVQAQIIHLLAEEVRNRHIALMMITHDMSIVAQLCDRVAVLYAGRVAEVSDVRALFAHPAHPYTRALIDCIPRPDMARGALTGIPGAVPAVADYPSGCRFHPRCPRATDLCRTQVPALVTDGRDSHACHHSLRDTHG